MSQAFRSAMAEAGLIPPAELVADGRIRRCHVVGHQTKSGAYLLLPGELWGGFQNWTTGEPWQRWSAKRDGPLSPEVIEAIREATKRAQATLARDREQARQTAERMWSAAIEGPHPYLTRKGIATNGSRVLLDRPTTLRLLLPLAHWNGAIQSLQTITADGKKKFLYGGQFHGCAHWIRCGSDVGPTIYICEGFATGATIHAASGGKPVRVAFACGNLLPVARVLRLHLPKARVIFVADNDHETSGNPGLTHATDAARAVHGLLVVPEGIRGTDVNDMQTELGIGAVRELLRFPRKPQAGRRS